MTPFIQALEALLVPALPPCLDTVEMNMELVRSLLQGQPLAQPHYRLCAYPGTWMRMKHARFAQCMLLNFVQY
ncbi:hypothetical protein CR152_16970 [Massilia violaceinigra]|uniref:Uncharacterized protein n=1 Tax=Massilia violaceinigra TaxID=2045208 RepID=A0A2D2DM72_9BURK|nr:hypothetical protein CR152_16970 [Massilia violaceinigra]